MLLAKCVCATWSVTMHRTSSRAVTWFVCSNALGASSELMFLVVVSRVLGWEPFNFDFLQSPRQFWIWSMTTTDLRGHRPWDAQLQGRRFLILSGWFARILRSMEIRCSFCICGQNVSSLMQRPWNAFYSFCVWDLIWPLNYEIGFFTWSMCVQVHVCVHMCMCTCVFMNMWAKGPWRSSDSPRVSHLKRKWI